jgi:polysaccharide pyruvyl transferase WcaK-like protein
MKALHLAIFDRNIGDNALNYVIDNMFKDKFDTYKTYNIYKKTLIDKNTIDYLNSFDVLIIGGGGLLSSHVPGKKITKWGTAIRIPLDKVKSKKVFYSLGYNNFYPDIAPAGKLVNQLDYIINDKNSYISLRNDGSKERLQDYIDSNKIRTIPDAGTFFNIKKEFPEYILINIAMDSIPVRYGSIEKPLKILEKVLKPYEKEKIMFAFHTPDDVRITKVDYFKILQNKFNISIYPFDNNYKNTITSWAVYSKAKFVIGTRGHSQILCAGNSIPCFSIDSHPKIRDYARLNNLGSFCSNIDDKDIFKKFAYFTENIEEYLKKCLKLKTIWDEQICNYNKELLNELYN